MVRLENGLEIELELDMVEKWLKVSVIEDKTVVVVVASYRSFSGNPVRFKALFKTFYRGPNFAVS